MKVIIPNYTTHYRKGDRVGTVIAKGNLGQLGPDGRGSIEVARVLLHQSGKTILVDLGECSVLQGEAS